MPISLPQWLKRGGCAWHPGATPREKWAWEGGAPGSRSQSGRWRGSWDPGLSVLPGAQGLGLPLSAWCSLTPRAVGPKEQEEVSSDCLSPWIPDRPDSECVMLWELWGAGRGWCGRSGGGWGRAVCGWIGNPACDTNLSRKHLCLFGQAAGRGQLCWVPTAASQDGFRQRVNSRRGYLGVHLGDRSVLEHSGNWRREAGGLGF